MRISPKIQIQRKPLPPQSGGALLLCAFIVLHGDKKKTNGFAVPPTRRNSTDFLASISRLRGVIQKGQPPFGRSGRVVPEGNPFGRGAYSRALCARCVPCTAVTPSPVVPLFPKCPAGIPRTRKKIAPAEAKPAPSPQRRNPTHSCALRSTGAGKNSPVDSFPVSRTQKCSKILNESQPFFLIFSGSLV